MNHQPRAKTIIRAQTADEEFDYLIKVLHKLDFYKTNGYPIPIPDHPLFLSIVNNPHILDTFDRDEARAAFTRDIYDCNFIENGLKTIKNHGSLIEKAMERMKNRETWWFKMFPLYQITLTAFGPGGSYDFRRGIIIMKTKETWNFGRVPYHTIIYEIIHIGIEECIVKKFELTHSEKEWLVDSICVHCFHDVLTDYRVQERGDADVFRLVSQDNIMDLPHNIRQYKKK